MRFMLLLMMLPAVVHAADPPIAERPQVTLGDVYEYDFPQAPFPCRRWQIAELDRDGLMVSTCGPFSTFASVAGDYNPVRLVDYDGNDLWSFTPYFPGVKFPLELRAEWSGEYAGFAADIGTHWNGKVACAVDAFEPVTVAAGTFDSYRIECTDSLYDQASGQAMGVLHSVRWYAPAVAAVVKTWNREDPRWNMELGAIERQ